MKYCLNYDPKLKCADSVDELQIEFNARDTSLPQFLEAHSNQTIVISLLNDDITKKNMELLRALSQKYSNFKVILNYTVENVVIVKTYGLPYFFYNPACDWASLQQLLNFNPRLTDVIIGGTLAFDIQEVSYCAHKKGVHVRCIANLAQSFIPTFDSVNPFFIRPEDVDYYAQFIDTLILVGEDKQLSTLYKIYHDDKKWSGPLKEIIFGLNSDINNKYIGPEFARMRSKCKKECGKCWFCADIQNLAKNAEKVKTALKEIPH